MAENGKRRLAAIMFTDIVDFSAMMQKDERQTLTLLKRHRDVLETLTEKHGGRVLQYFGDGSLSLYDSAVEAVRCAREMQQVFRTSPAVPLRIGLHLGDVSYNESIYYGDGVNIASRIETLGAPGSVLFSQKIYDEIKNQADFRAAYLGSFELKNIDQEQNIYGLTSDGLVLPDPKKISGKLKGETYSTVSKNIFQKWFPWIGWMFAILLTGALFTNIFQKEARLINEAPPLEAASKSIAVLPLRNMSGDPSKEYLSDGITEAILSQLSLVENLRVVSRSSSFYYKNKDLPIRKIAKELGVEHIVNGSVQLDGETLKISVILTNAIDDQILWPKNYTRELDNLFDIQRDIAFNIVENLKVKFSNSEQKLLDSPPTTDFNAYDYYLKGLNYFNRFLIQHSENDYKSAVFAYKEALKIDTDYPSALTGLAGIYFEKNLSTNIIEGQWVDSVMLLCNNALEVSPDHAAAYHWRGRIFWLKGQYVRAINNLEKAIDLDPNNSLAMYHLAQVYINRKDQFGQYDRGLYLLKKAASFERNEDLLHYIYVGIGKTYASLEMYEDARKFFRKAMETGKGKAKEDYGYISWVTALKGNFDEALKFALDELEKAPENIHLLDNVGHWYAFKGEYKMAEKYYRQMMKIVEKDEVESLTFRSRLAYVLWMQGEKKEAQQLFNEQIEICQRSMQHGNYEGDMYDLAGIYAFLDRKEEAYELLRQPRTLLWRFGTSFIMIDPLFESIREEPEFKKIMHKIELKKQQMRVQVEKIDLDLFAEYEANKKRSAKKSKEL